MLCLIDSLSEIGEETGDLPYLRHRKRSCDGAARNIQPDRGLKVTDPSKLIIAKRLVDAFNMGDFDVICEVIEESCCNEVEVEMPFFQKKFIGKQSFISLWQTLLDAFPDGSFRLSDTTVDYKLQLLTKFVFAGTKVFPIEVMESPTSLIYSSSNLNGRARNDDSRNDVPHGGIDHIVQAMYETGEIDFLDEISVDDEFEGTSSDNSNGHGDSVGIDMGSHIVSSESKSNSQNMDPFNSFFDYMDSNSRCFDNEMPNPRANGLCQQQYGQQQQNIGSSNANGSLSSGNNFSYSMGARVSRTQPVYTLANLSMCEEAPPVVTCEGKMVFQLNEKGYIRKFRCHWRRI